MTTVGGEDAYPTIWSKAGALLQSIVDEPRAHRRQQAPRLARHRRLPGGQRRPAWLAATNDDVYDLVIAVVVLEIEH
ncbi:MAG: hypothetical protein V9F03_05435 [Microthrixaceae bacterium]